MQLEVYTYHSTQYAIADMHFQEHTIAGVHFLEHTMAGMHFLMRALGIDRQTCNNKLSFDFKFAVL
ncbi:Fibronectin type III and SPRY domain-containing protein 1 [Frankliniella fusca]|uniref:Fibronectin type III and SPRY domain-containing protein 1 n=1 Tax=Frankliniella fusca TaxID=407009 RepID=A0AAE1L9U7_9NEOP|nr:Fibronectin type III and SPRY domain-containing protein 1 [Frankliniella fusca]